MPKEKLCPIVPVGPKLVIKRSVSESKTKGGIIIPEKAQAKQQEGLVVATGTHTNENGTSRALQVSVGDTVVFTEYGATEVSVGGDKYVIISELDILGIIRPQ